MIVQALKARNCEEFNQYAEPIARLQRFEISAASYLGRWPRLLQVAPLALNKRFESRILKPNVLQLIDSFNQGGSESQALQLTRLLLESGRFQVHLACLSPEGSLRSTIENLDLGEIPSFPLKSFYDKNAVKQLRRFVSWLRTSRIDILHTHDFYTNVFGMAGASLARGPVRIASMRETAGMRSAAQKKVQRVGYSLAHHIVANSNAVRDRLINDGIPAEKVSIIYNGLDLKRLETSATRSEALSHVGVKVDDARPSIHFNCRQHAA